MMFTSNRSRIDGRIMHNMIIEYWLWDQIAFEMHRHRL